MTSRSEKDDFSLAMELATGSATPMIIKVAIELNVFEIIAKAGPGAQLSPEFIASQLPAKNPNAALMLDRIMRLLASYSVLNASLVTHENGLVGRLYGLGPLGKYFVQEENELSVSPFLLLAQDKITMDCWYYLKDAILEGGIPFNKAHGMHLFEYPGVDLRFNQVFNRAMVSNSTGVMKAILETYNGLEGVNEVVDVGGGIGITVSIITSKYPTIKAINFDLPHVIEHAPPYPGVEHIGGDMFHSVPSGETILMKWILHDWNDENCLKILKNCYKALPDKGKLIIVEAILPIEAETSTTAKDLFKLDVAVMTQCPEGKERTSQEFDVLAKGAGFSSMKKVQSGMEYQKGAKGVEIKRILDQIGIRSKSELISRKPTRKFEPMRKSRNLQVSLYTYSESTKK